MSPGASGEPLSPLVLEDRVLFGISASHPSVKTVHELSKTYSTVDTATIAREVHTHMHVYYVLCLLVGKSIAWKADGCGFESHLRQPIFLWKWLFWASCVVLLCLSIVLLLLSCFQHLLKWLFIHVYASKLQKYSFSFTPSIVVLRTYIFL